MTLAEVFLWSAFAAVSAALFFFGLMYEFKHSRNGSKAVPAGRGGEAQGTAGRNF